MNRLSGRVRRTDHGTRKASFLAESEGEWTDTDSRGLLAEFEGKITNSHLTRHLTGSPFQERQCCFCRYLKLLQIFTCNSFTYFSGMPKNIHSINLGSTTIEYKLRRDKRAKHFRIIMHDDGLCVVTVPLPFGKIFAEKFLKEQASWIRKQKEKQKCKDQECEDKLTFSDVAIVIGVLIGLGILMWLFWKYVWPWMFGAKKGGDGQPGNNNSNNSSSNNNNNSNSNSHNNSNNNPNSNNTNQGKEGNSRLAGGGTMFPRYFLRYQHTN